MNDTVEAADKPEESNKKRVGVQALREEIETLQVRLEEQQEQNHDLQRNLSRSVDIMGLRASFAVELKNEFWDVLCDKSHPESTLLQLRKLHEECDYAAQRILERALEIES